MYILNEAYFSDESSLRRNNVWCISDKGITHYVARLATSNFHITYIRGIFKRLVDIFSLECNISHTAKHLYYWTPISALYKIWNNDKHLTIYKLHMGLWTQSTQPMRTTLGKLLATSVTSVYWTRNVHLLGIFFSKYSPFYVIHFRCRFNHLKIALYQSWLYCEMMFAEAECNSGRDENRRPFICDLTLGYTSKSNFRKVWKLQALYLWLD